MSTVSCSYPLREIAVPFVAAAPVGARVRTRLRASPQDAAVLRAVGVHLGSLAGRDLAARCAEGRLGEKGKAESRAVRKRALTGQSSARWAGAITRTSEDAWQLADRNLRAEQASLRVRIRTITTRLAVPAGRRRGRLCGYANPAERHSKSIRLKTLQGRLARVDADIADGRVRVTRGGRRLLRARANLAAAGLTERQWQARWEASRIFLTADGEAAKPWGNETIRWHPDEGWLELKLPAPLASLANRPHGRYRLSCPVAFGYRADAVAAQTASGAVRYDITLNPESGRWYLDASWTFPVTPAPSLDELRAHSVVAVDVNVGHLAVAVITPDGNVLGAPRNVILDLAGLPAAVRDGRLRAAISVLIAIARAHGARAIVIEDLDFVAARAEGREWVGKRPSRGRPGRRFRRMVAGIPTGKFRDRLTQMTANADLCVLVIDPAYTSRWGAEHWLLQLKQHHPETTGHHAAALVIGRRGLGYRARRRATGNRIVPEETTRPTQARPRTTPKAPPARRKPATARDPRQPTGAKTGRPHSTPTGNQATEDRSRPPTEPIRRIARCLGTV
jgi:hypothetical protein